MASTTGVPMGVLLAASQANAKVAPIGQQSAVLLAMLLLGACCCCICIVQWRTLRRRRGEDGESEQEPLLSNTPSSSNVRHRQQSSDIASIGTPARDFVRLSALPAAVFQPRSAALRLSHPHLHLPCRGSSHPLIHQRVLRASDVHSDNRCRACNKVGECVALRPCGHAVLCRPCSDFVFECPLCGQYISGISTEILPDNDVSRWDNKDEPIRW